MLHLPVWNSVLSVNNNWRKFFVGRSFGLTHEAEEM
jgi:hypothetical protein